MKILKKLIFSVLFFSSLSAFFAQQISFNDPFVLDYVSRVWKADDGLSGNSVTDIVQTNDGYIYLGTYDGLVRFDGVEFLNINKNTEARVSFVSARTVFQDSEGNFWIGANDEGVTCIRIDGTSVKYDTENGLPNNSIRAFCEAKDGTIWIGTSAGIAWIKDGVVSVPEENALPNENKVLVKKLFLDSNGKVWVITSDGNGTLVYSEGNFSKYTGIKKVNPMAISTVMQDSSGVFWFGVSPHYVVRYDGKSETVYDIGFGAQKGTVVNCIEQDSFGNLWCALDTGITVIHDNILSYMDTTNILSDEKVVKILEDRENNIWVATDRGGIQKLSRTKFKTVNMGTSVNAITRDLLRDCVWVAGDNGLYCIKAGDSVHNEITEYCKNIRIRHVEYTSNGNLLISAYERLGQVRVKPDGTITSWTKEKDGLTGNKVRVALEASDGKIYIGTTTGLNIVDAKTDRLVNKITKDNGISNDYIMCIYEAEDGTVWCGTDGGGVFLLRDGKVLGSFTSENGLAGNVIFKINSFSEDEIWLCTGTGISICRNGKFYNFNAANGLGTDSVFQVIPDSAGKIWCTSNKGIFNVSIQDFEEVISGAKNKVKAKYFGRSDGIVSGGVTSTSLSMKDEEGRLWFTLIDGFTKYDSVKGSYNRKAPIVHVQNIMIDNNENIIPAGKPIVLSSANKRLNIKYTGLSFVSSELVEFKYKLEGFDKDFSDWSTNREVSYTNLKPGVYKFMIITRNSDGVLSKPSGTITLIKKAAFWQQIWFYVLIFMVFAFCVYLLIKSRIAHLKADNNRLQQIYMEITRALTGTIDAKDKYTNGHSERVAKYSLMIAERAGLSEKEQQNIYMMAILHDIGKIGIPDSIINKPGKLTDEEFEVIKTHPVIGSEILQSIKSVKGIAIGARSHHERYDGKGYPDHLKGNEIPYEARIIGVADAYDAMTSNRSYRNYLPQEVVREQIEKGKGTQFDPEYADNMLEIIDEDKEYMLHG